jgi:hypothetical protein
MRLRLQSVEPSKTVASSDRLKGDTKMTNKNAKRYSSDDDDDPNVLADGQKLRVPLYLLDSTQRAVAAHARAHARPLVVDSRGQPCGGRPGHLLPSPSNKRALADALDSRARSFRDLDRRSKNAWRTVRDETAAEATAAESENEQQDDTLAMARQKADASWERANKVASEKWRAPSPWPLTRTFPPELVQQAAALAATLQIPPPVIVTNRRPVTYRVPGGQREVKVGDVAAARAQADSALAELEERSRTAWRRA